MANTSLTILYLPLKQAGNHYENLKQNVLNALSQRFASLQQLPNLEFKLNKAMKEFPSAVLRFENYNDFVKVKVGLLEEPLMVTGFRTEVEQLQNDGAVASTTATTTPTPRPAEIETPCSGAPKKQNTPKSAKSTTPKATKKKKKRAAKKASNTSSASSPDSANVVYPFTVPVLLPDYHAQYFVDMVKVKRALEKDYRVVISLSVICPMTLDIRGSEKTAVDAAVAYVKSFEDKFHHEVWTASVIHPSHMSNFCREHNIWIQSKFRKVATSKNIRDHLLMPISQKGIFQKRFQKKLPTAKKNNKKAKKDSHKEKSPPAKDVKKSKPSISSTATKAKPPQIVRVFYPIHRHTQQALVTQFKPELQQIQQDAGLTSIQLDSSFEKTHRRGLLLTGTESSIRFALPTLDTLRDTLYTRRVTATVPIESSLCLDWMEYFKYGSSITRFLKPTTGVHLLFPKMESEPPRINSINLSTNRVLELYEGDLLKMHVDAYVNSANIKLHNAGGVAKVIQDASSNPPMVKEIEYLKEYTGRMPQIGEAWHTISAPSNAQYVIHAFPPEYRNGDTNTKQLMVKCIKSILVKAHELKITSIALPVLGAGIFSWPVETVVSIIFNTIENYLPQSIYLQRVVIVDQSKKCLKELKKKFASHHHLNDTGRNAGIATKDLDLVTNFYGCDAEIKDKQPGFFSSIFNKLSMFSQKSPAADAWYWKNEKGHWEGYDSRVNALINKYTSTGVCRVSINSVPYSIDINSGVQKNLKTGHQREVAKNVSANKVYQWEWQNANGFKPYDEQNNSLISDAYNKKLPSVDLNQVLRHCDDQNGKYRIDFSSMQQINLSTNYKRKIRCKEVGFQVAQPKVNVVQPSAPSAARAEIPKQKLHVRILTFDIRDAFAVQSSVEKLIDQWRTTDEFATGLPLKECKEFADKVGCFCNATKTGICISGSSTNVELVKQYIQAAEKSKSPELPPQWERDSSGSDGRKLFALNPQSAEYIKIQKLFHASSPNRSVQSIQRVQNMTLWQKYDSHKKELEKQKGKILREELLFHGTRNTDPASIYASAKGFDKTYAQDSGTYSSGFYFAQNSSYSVSYASTDSRGRKQMLVARVLVGDTAKLPQRKYQRPPEGYDSIQGHLSGSDCFIVYHSECVYPNYLVTFQ